MSILENIKNNYIPSEPGAILTPGKLITIYNSRERLPLTRTHACQIMTALCDMNVLKRLTRGQYVIYSDTVTTVIKSKTKRLSELVPMAPDMIDAPTLAASFNAIYSPDTVTVIRTRMILADLMAEGIVTRPYRGLFQRTDKEADKS